jgi:hypothetical protein
VIALKHAPEPLAARRIIFPGGDLMSARAHALQILAALGQPSLRTGAVVLILTAACLHLSAGMGPDPTLDDVRLFLEQLADGSRGAWRSLSTSRLPFLQYVAAEFDDGGRANVDDTIRFALSAVKAELDTNGQKGA